MGKREEGLQELEVRREKVVGHLVADQVEETDVVADLAHFDGEHLLLLR